MNLNSQKSLASKILKVGVTRVWIDPEKTDDVEVVITREEIRKLVHEGTIRAVPKRGISRSRARILHEKRKRGLRKGVGSRTGKKTARMPRKKAWQLRIKAIRNHLKELRMLRTINKDVYRKLYLMAKGGEFSTVSHLDKYIDANKLVRRR